MSKGKIGQIFEIKLEEKYAYCRIVSEGLFKFFDYFGHKLSACENIVDLKPLFSLYVHKSVFRQSKWNMLCLIELSSTEISNPPRFFKQDMHDLNSCWIVDILGNEIRCKPEDCIGMERPASWNYEDVEKGLKTYFDDLPDIYMDRIMNVQIPYQ